VIRNYQKNLNYPLEYSSLGENKNRLVRQNKSNEVLQETIKNSPELSNNNVEPVAEEIVANSKFRIFRISMRFLS